MQTCLNQNSDSSTLLSRSMAYFITSQLLVPLCTLDLGAQKLAAAKSALNKMQSMGICAKVSSPWASLLHMVTKQDGSWRPCGDHRRLNLISVPDQYQMPNITNNMGNARIFTKLDLLKEYFQVPVHKDDVPKTAIITLFGSYVFYFSTFGLRNSGATFQRIMDSIFGQTSNCLVYIDDLLVFFGYPGGTRASSAHCII